MNFLFVPGWRTRLAQRFLQEPPTADATITFSGHGTWLSKRPVHNLQTANPLKLMRKWTCSKGSHTFQSFAETEPRSLINIQISNQYFKKNQSVKINLCIRASVFVLIALHFFRVTLESSGLFNFKLQWQSEAPNFSCLSARFFFSQKQFFSFLWPP